MDLGRYTGSVLGTAAGTEIGSFGLTNWPIVAAAYRWLNPRAGITPDSLLRIPSWTDAIASDPFAEAVDGNKPTYDSTGINGRPAVRFTAASSQRLSTTSSLAGDLDTLAPYSMLVALRAASFQTGNASYFGLGAASNNAIVHLFSSGGADRASRTLNAANTLNTGTITSTVGVATIVSVVYDGSVYNSWVRGAPSMVAAANVRAAATLTIASVGGRFTNGSWGAASAHFDGWMGDLILFSSAISDAVRQAGERWLALRYGVVMA